MSDPDPQRTAPGRTLVILAVAGVAYAVAQTLVIPAIATIQKDYNATENAATWVLTAFLLTSSVFTPLLGRMGDMYGKERMLLVALGVFGLGNVVCGIGGSLAILIAGRAIQGAGGAIFPLAFGIIRDEFPRERVAPSIGVMSAMFGVGGGVGFVAAGLMVDHLGVGSIFWSSVVVTAAAAWATWRFVPESPVRVQARLDLGGAALLGSGLALLLLGVSQGNDWGWSSERIVALFTGALVVLAIFVAYELAHPEPMIDMQIMRRRAVWTTNLAAVAVGFAVFGCYLLIPAIMQAPRSTGYGFAASVTGAGLTLIPSSLIMFFMGPLSGRIGARFGSRLPLALGCAGGLIAYAWLAALHAAVWQIVVGGCFIGIGIGLAYAAMGNLVIEAVEPHQTGVAGAVNTIARLVGAAIGGQAAAAILAGTHSAVAGYPTDAGYTDAFLLSGVGAVVALAATALIPRPGAATAARARRATGAAPEPAEA